MGYQTDADDMGRLFVDNSFTGNQLSHMENSSCKVNSWWYTETKRKTFRTVRMRLFSEAGKEEEKFLLFFVIKTELSSV